MKYVKNEFTKQEIAKLSEKLAGKKALLALSGGVDSAVCAGLLHKAAPKSLTCVFVDTGLMRKGEVSEVKRVFGDEMGLNLVVVNAESIFLEKLKGVTDPEKKRKIIGEEFIRVFEKESKSLGAVDFLVQGTIYPDIAESGGDGHKNVKSHHNVGGLPSVIDFKEILEPLRDLYKDEVRKVGFELGLPKEIVMRQPFPGPGLAVRVIGEVTKERLGIVREADFIFRDEIKNAGLEYEIWQYFAVLTDIKSVGVRQGERTYENMIALRAVNSTDAMSATCAKIPADVLEKVSARIVNEVTGVNRVVYDITNKPPSTIEWE